VFSGFRPTDTYVIVLTNPDGLQISPIFSMKLEFDAVIIDQSTHQPQCARVQSVFALHSSRDMLDIWPQQRIPRNLDLRRQMASLVPDRQQFRLRGMCDNALDGREVFLVH
jgi:hypothetical protein